MYKEITQDRYDEMLCVLPPRARRAWSFLVGEPRDHQGEKIISKNNTIWGEARYMMYVEREGKFYEMWPHTIDQFNGLLDLEKSIGMELIRQEDLSANLA